MKLSSVLSTNHIVLGLNARTLREAIPEILDRIEERRSKLLVSTIVEALIKRENNVPTVASSGIAVPHARISQLRDFYVLLGRATRPFEDLDADGRPIDLVFIILCNDQKNTLMLQTLAAVGLIAHDNALLERIRTARTREEVWHAIDESGIPIKKGLYARDIMRPIAIILSKDMTLRDFLDRCAAARVHDAPVCDDRGAVVGSVSSREVIEAGFPEYMTGLRDIAFLNNSESFLEFFRREDIVRVEEIMNRRPLVVLAEDPLIQVVFQMRRHKERLAFVVDNGRCVGVVDRDDICERILRP